MATDHARANIPRTTQNVQRKREEAVSETDERLFACLDESPGRFG